LPSTPWLLILLTKAQRVHDFDILDFWARSCASFLAGKGKPSWSELTEP
jgi:hypothetical protein